MDGVTVEELIAELQHTLSNVGPNVRVGLVSDPRSDNEWYPAVRVRFHPRKGCRVILQPSTPLDTP